MDAKDLEAGVMDTPLLPLDSQSGAKLHVAADTDSLTNAAPRLPWTDRLAATPPIVRLSAYANQLHVRASARFEETYPRVLDALRRILKLCFLSFMIIVVVMFASWFIALSQWFTVVFGHLFLRYTVSATIDDSFATKRMEHTLIFAALGAFVVNLPPLIIFLLSFPLTFDRTVLEGSTAPANEFIKRVTPKNRYALLFLKYAPRLFAGPVGCALYLFIQNGDGVSEDESLDPLHAAIAGVAGEVVLTLLGLAKDRFLPKRRASGASGAGNGGKKDVLPMPTTA